MYVKGKFNLTNEFMKRGLSMREAFMLTEACYSCAIEGNKIPTTKEEIDELVKGAKHV
jgi:hypothetical protein